MANEPENYGGPYLHEVEREKAELTRAKIEGRDPDLTNPGATAGDNAQELSPHLVTLASEVEAQRQHSEEELETSEPDEDPFKESNDDE